MRTNGAKKGRQGISQRQITLMHTLSGAMGWDRETYEMNLAEQTGKESSLHLSWREAEEVLEDWTRKAVGMGVWKPRGTAYVPSAARPQGNAPGSATPPYAKGGQGRKRWAELDGRPGMATGAQCRMIEAMWAEVSRAGTAEEKERALAVFMRRIVRVDHFRWLKGWQVQMLVKAIEEMKKAKKEE